MKLLDSHIRPRSSGLPGGASSFPVNDSPAEFHPALIQISFPMDRTTGSSGIRHSIATSWS